MKRTLIIIFLHFSLCVNAQSVFGYWYGFANVKTSGSANNYLVELILNQDKGFVKGVLNYYFKNTYRSLQVKGNYNTATRELNLYEIHIPYHASTSDL